MNRVETKAEWRAWARSLAPASVAESAAVAAHVGAFASEAGWKRILSFLAMPGEVDLAGVEGGFDVAVTRTPRQGPLTVHQLSDDLETHALGYRQPRADAPRVALETIEAVLVPGVLFAREGGRLGHGKGYYDTLLAKLAPRPYLLGVTLERRLVDRLPMTETDIYMDAIATEAGITPTRS